MMSSLKDFLGLSAENEQEEYEESHSEADLTSHDSELNNNKRDNVLNMKDGVPAKSKIMLYEPRVYSDAKDVAQNLLNDKAVIINFSRMEDESARRVVDFITGTIYALNGKIQRIGDKIFLATPPRFVTDGKISELLDKKDNLD